METIRSASGDALRDLRLDAWMSQADLASAAGVREATISGIETGRIQNPRRKTLMALAKALSVHPNTLLAEEGRESAPLTVVDTLKDEPRVGGAWDLRSPDRDEAPIRVDDSSEETRFAPKYAGNGAY